MVNFTRTNKIVILIIAIAITMSLGYKTLINNPKEIEIRENELFLEEDEIETLSVKDNQENEQIEENQNISEVVVHIAGEVESPGIVTLKSGSRVIDAINMAGGLTSFADERNINLAQKLFDEDKIIIPKLGENIESEDFAFQSIETFRNDSQSTIVNRNLAENSSGLNSSGMININTASKEELKSLSGIGDVTAQKIMDYRESNRFNSIEDIKNVSGIGDKKFETIKSMITTR